MTTTTHAARVILIGKAAWTDRIEQALNDADLAGAQLDVVGVDDFLCAFGEASRGQVDVVIGQLDRLDGMNRSIAEGFRRIAPRVLLLLTAPASQQEAAAVALVDGFDDYVLEPVDAHILARLVGPRVKPRIETTPVEPVSEPLEPVADYERGEVEADQEAVNVPVPADDALPEPQTQDKTAPERRGRDRRPAWPGMPNPEEVELLDHLLAERRPIATYAMPMLERRSRIHDVRYITADGELPAKRTVAPVEHDDRLLGYLHAPPGADEAALQAWAAWLARWVGAETRQHELWKQAHIDELTGVWNRRYFDRRLNELVDHAQQHRARVTLMIFDIDDFKTYNDRFGHDAGDDILRETARLMRSVVRTHDIVARIGGDEFAVIFWDAEQRRRPESQHPDDVRRAAERFQAAVNAAEFPKLGPDAPGPLTISGGLAGYPWDAHDAAELFQAADAAAMRSKRAGKNALTFG